MTHSLQPINGQIMTEGVLIVGTHAECGKTIAATGLAGAMVQNGLRMQAIKPLEFAAPGTLKQTLDQDYMNRVLRPLQRPENLIFDTFHAVTPVDWNRLIHYVQGMTYPCLIESPGCYSTPLFLKNDELRDGAFLAHELGIPILLVTEKSPLFLQRLRGAIRYLRSCETSLIGWVSVETHQQSNAPFWEKEVNYIIQQEQCPYLGNIAYSPSIGVTQGHQGNLIHRTQEGVDLLPIQMGAGIVLTR